MYARRTEALITQKLEDSMYRSSSIIGEVIRRIRLEKNYTQNTLSKGLCSVSYLSKLENGRIIPKNNTIQRISERLDIDSTYLQAHLDASAFIREVIVFFFYEDIEELGNTIERTKHFEDDTVRSMLKLSLYASQGKWHDAKRKIASLEPHVGTMTHRMLELFLMLSCVTAYEIQDYKTALALSDTLNTMDEKCHEIEVLHKLYKAYICYAMGKSISAEYYGNLAHRYLEKHQSLKRLVTLELYRLHYSMKENKAVGKALLEKIDVELALNVYPSMAHFIFGHAYYLLGDYKAAIGHFTKVLKLPKDQWYARCVIGILKITKKDSKLYRRIRGLMLTNAVEENSLKEKVWFTQYDERVDSDRKRYIMSIALPLAKQTHDLEALDEYTEWLIQYAKKNARYKEALSSYQQRKKYVAKLRDRL